MRVSLKQMVRHGDYISALLYNNMSMQTHKLVFYIFIMNNFSYFLKTKIYSILK